MTVTGGPSTSVRATVSAIPPALARAKGRGLAMIDSSSACRAPTAAMSAALARPHPTFGARLALGVLQLQHLRDHRSVGKCPGQLRAVCPGGVDLGTAGQAGESASAAASAAQDVRQRVQRRLILDGQGRCAVRSDGGSDSLGSFLGGDARVAVFGEQRVRDALWLMQVGQRAARRQGGGVGVARGDGALQESDTTWTAPGGGQPWAGSRPSAANRRLSSAATRRMAAAP